MQRKKLGLEERLKLYELRSIGYGVRTIGKRLGRQPSTISRELKRNGDNLYQKIDYISKAHQSQDAAHRRRVTASGRMRLRNEVIRHFTEFHIREAAWSPEAIAGRLTILGYPISYEAIYQYIEFEKPELKANLKISGRSRRRRRAGKRKRVQKQPAAPKRSIEQLPVKSRERTEIGHFELDAIIGKKGFSVLQNKTDRMSRKVFLDKSPSLMASTYSDIVVRRLAKDVPKNNRHTILQDNGVEHAAHPVTDAALGVDSYFSHPYCSSERGTVENRNKAIRYYFPKGTNFDEIPDEFIEFVEDQLNNTPMKVLGFRTPNEVWFQNIAA